MFLFLIFFLIYAPALRANGSEVLVSVSDEQSVMGCSESAMSGAYYLTPVPKKVTETKGCYSFVGEPEVRIQVRQRDFSSPEAYVLEVSPKGVFIKAGGDAGAFYAQQTLAQLIAFSASGADGASDSAGVSCSDDASGKAGVLQTTTIQCVRIEDEPRFGYRGLHVDVSRHFRSVEFLKKQMDAMALFKMNKMHLHLTDAAGWRIQIDAYPRLTEFAAWRPEALWKDWWEGQRLYAQEDSEGAYGGYYTKHDIAELVRYAAERHIELIPEIEMPSHSEEVLAAYPELGCSGEAYKDSDFCVGKEEVFTFLETVLDEVIEMFPSEFIHIGGDEAGKQHWITCPDCQQRMRDEGLTDVDELQSYMIRRIGEFVASRGRRIIGWDEILQGGLASGATVMSWRGTEGGIEAMKMGHDVIMSPGRYCYLDHAQDAPFREPESIGGYLPLDSVYVYEPIEKTMPAEGLHHLLGVQANLWSEYVPTDEHAEYMYWPRAIAIAETGWSMPENKCLSENLCQNVSSETASRDFRTRALKAIELLQARGYNTFDLANEYGERKLAQTGLEHKAKGKSVKYLKPIQEWYPAAGEKTFTDGVIGGWTYSDKRWQGFLSEIDVVIDLEQVQTISYVGGTFMQLKGPGVFMPQKVEISVSEDGEDFELIATVWNDVSTEIPDLLFRSFDTITSTKARYVRYHAYRSPKRGFIFLDEIIVN